MMMADLAMCVEVNRLNSFTNWPIKYMKASDLARAGFYYTQHEDRVRCAFCFVEIGCWQRGDHARLDHLRWSPECPYMTGRNVGNIPHHIAENSSVEFRPNSYPERECPSPPSPPPAEISQDKDIALLCKICLINGLQIVLLPCAHLCTCVNCFKRITMCPICRKIIDGYVRTYLS